MVKIEVGKCESCKHACWGSDMSVGIPLHMENCKMLNVGADDEYIEEVVENEGNKCKYWEHNMVYCDKHGWYEGAGGCDECQYEAYKECEQGGV